MKKCQGFPWRNEREEEILEKERGVHGFGTKGVKPVFKMQQKGPPMRLKHVAESVSEK